jgi:hypothetical protein
MTAADELLQHCDSILPGHGPVASIAERLREIADSLGGDQRQDVHGAVEYLQSFEREVADMLGNTLRFEVDLVAPFMARLLAAR